MTAEPGSAISAIVEAHRSGRWSPRDTIERCFERIRRHDDPAIFISLRDEQAVQAEAEALTSAVDAEALPLYGVPVAVKDNIDVAGLPTTAACPAFAYRPTRDATAVARLRAAGAIVIGKTNLDQFATGLVGVRSPYGVPRNACHSELIPGGSSSGSAVAVAAGLVPLAVGTDTAGSGRIPAGFNNIVGLKPSLGVISTAGVVPACRTLDCVSVLALTVDDAWTAAAVMAGFDASDPYSRTRPLGRLGRMPSTVKIGIPASGQRVFFGSAGYRIAYDAALDRLVRLGCEPVTIDIEPFYEAARLLYEGPWLAERFLTVQPLIASAPDALHPITRQIIAEGARPSAADAFSAFYRLQDLRRVADRIFADIDAMALPTAPRAYCVRDVMADPIQLNSRLGTYTNFVNLLDLCALALPAAFGADRTPFGITLLAPGGADARLAAIGRIFHADTMLPLGGLHEAHPNLAPLQEGPRDDEIAIAVVGAHMSGLPLNSEIRVLGGRYLETTRTAQCYKLFELADTTPPKPGLLRVENGGSTIALEIWALPAAQFGRFISGVPSPLSIGTITLADARTVKSFLVEAAAVETASDISRFGGWRAYLNSEPDHAGRS